MGKPPAFQFYAGDWLASTLGMAWDVKGLYIDLLAWSWVNGPLPDDAKWRRKMIGTRAEKRWASVSKRWRKTARGWINLRLELQRKTQRNYQAKAAKAAGIRWNRENPSIAQAYAPGMLGRRRQASFKHVLEPSSSSSSSSSSVDQEQPAAARPVIAPPFKIYSAIARRAIVEEPQADLGEVAERFKRHCAAQRLPYDATVATKAITAALAALAKRA